MQFLFGRPFLNVAYKSDIPNFTSVSASAKEYVWGHP